MGVGAAGSLALWHWRRTARLLLTAGRIHQHLWSSALRDLSPSARYAPGILNFPSPCPARSWATAAHSCCSFGTALGCPCCSQHCPAVPATTVEFLMYLAHQPGFLLIPVSCDSNCTKREVSVAKTLYWGLGSGCC